MQDMIDILDDDTSVELLYKQHPYAYKPTSAMDICRINAVSEGISLGQYLENKTMDGFRTFCIDFKPHKFGKLDLFMCRWLGFNVGEMQFWRRMKIGRCLNCGAGDKHSFLLSYQHNRMFETYKPIKLLNRIYARKNSPNDPNFLSEGAFFKCLRCGCRRWISAK